jgi:hypothetical protein
LSENHAVYEIMSKNLVEPERPQMTIWRSVACWISKTTRASTRSRLCTPITHPYTHAHAHTHERAHVHIQNMQYLLLFHGNNRFVNTPRCYVIRTLPPFLLLMEARCIHCEGRTEYTEWRKSAPHTAFMFLNVLRHVSFSPACTQCRSRRLCQTGNRANCENKQINKATLFRMCRSIIRIYVYIFLIVFEG